MDNKMIFKIDIRNFRCNKNDWRNEKVNATFEKICKKMNIRPNDFGHQVFYTEENWWSLLNPSVSGLDCEYVDLKGKRKIYFNYADFEPSKDWAYRYTAITITAWHKETRYYEA